MNYKHLKQTYFVKTFVEACDKNDEDIVFNSSVTNLYELGRQYKNVPESIKELSNPKLIGSFNRLVANSTLIEQKGKHFIIDKNIKVLAQALFAFSQSQTTKSIEAIYNIVINQKTAIGSIKNLRKLIEHEAQINELTKNEVIELRFLSELIDLICSYLIHVGYSFDTLYANYNNHYSRYLKGIITLDDCYHSILSDVVQKIRSGKEKSQQEDFAIEIVQETVTPKKLENTFKKIYEEDEVFKDYIRKWSINKTGYSIIIDIEVEYIDFIRAKEVLVFLIHKVEIYLKSFSPRNEIKLYRVSRDSEEFPETTEIGQEKKREDQLALDLKYFNQLFEKSRWEDIQSESYKSIWRIADWYEKLSEHQYDKQVLFTGLWSALEFILIGDTKGDKKELVYKRLLPYMGLFYFRKTFKTYYKNFALSRINYSKEGLSTSFQETNAYLQDKVEGLVNLPPNLSAANTYLAYMLNTTFEDRWEGFDFKEADSLFIKLSSELILTDLIGQINRFENVIYNDLDQIYRLRNMLTHSGDNDDITLNNTFNRLKYYVQTIINSISFSYLNNPMILSDFEHLHELKEKDYEKYKSSLLKNLEKNRKNLKGWIKLVELDDDYIVSIPPNAYTKFGVE
ncbi:hypothetical protein M3557_14550 [Bhargavaea ginsengi]|uniref:hypothetical protein n=1 Tax=Bhargavaea ginsengi TaxID=426757 RepID=UPI00203E1BB1|nr:hypothetical protein [Bhargavaea ginsengi]MCM3089136.1 hypothetical protein [Bhargavaea ginsengi]